MKIVINLILAALIVVFAWVLFSSISEPIKFRDEKTKRKNRVEAKLKEIRSAQELYRGVTGEFAGSFDTLRQVLSTGNFRLINVQGDPDDPTNPEAVIYDTVLVPAIDSVRSLGLTLEDIEYVPYTDKQKKFTIAADTISYQSTVVPVVEVGVKWADFMGDFADKKFKKYDSSYQPGSVMKFGDMSSPQLNISGN